MNPDLYSPSPQRAFNQGMTAGPYDVCPYAYPELADEWERGKHTAACVVYVAQYGELSPFYH